MFPIMEGERIRLGTAGLQSCFNNSLEYLLQALTCLTTLLVRWVLARCLATQQNKMRLICQ
jgi:hypothetical protein